MPPTLLLADDSVTIQRVIELTFAHEEVRVIATSNGRQAIERIDAEHPDIVLADVSMPEVDGYAVSAHVKSSPSLRDTVVLLLTGAFEPVDEARVHECECDGVLVKPFEPQQLVALVKDLLGRREASEAGPATVVVAESVPAGAKRRGQGAAGKSGAKPLASSAPSGSDAAFGAGVDESLATIDLTPSDGTTPAPESADGSSDQIWNLTPVRFPKQSQALVPVPDRSLASAFSSLLASEHPQPAYQIVATPAVVPEAMVEDVVRRVLTSLTGDMVRSVVVDTAERLVREEIEKIKTTDPESEG